LHINVLNKILNNLNKNKNFKLDDTKIAYSEIRNSIKFYNSFFKSLKIKNYNCISIKLSYGIDYVSIILSAYINGLRVLILNPKSKFIEDIYKIKDSGVKLLFSELNLNQSKKLHNGLYLKMFNSIKNPNFKKEDLFIIYTSGTTKKPKGVVLSEKNLSTNIESITRDLKLNKSSSTIIFSNPSYAMGLSQVLTFLSLGAPFILCRYGFLFPKKILDFIKQYKIKVININSSMAKILDLVDTSKQPYNFVKIVMHGGMPLDKKVYKYFQIKFPKAKIINFYGCTENSPRVSHFEIKKYSNINYVGVPMRGIRTKILNKIKLKNGNYKGELAISGPSLTRGYLNLRKINKIKFKNDYFLTGDLVEVDKDSKMILIGRVDNMFRVGHEKLEPEEIENHINGINGVEETFVTKIKDKILNWVPICFIKRSDKKLTKNIIYNLLEKSLDNYKIPKKIYFVRSLYKTQYGKLDRYKIEKKYTNNN
tara:strand:+ start:3075 stop:4514 length:1440 start_codon:yes stop_codon:yes gene_type:complete